MGQISAFPSPGTSIFTGENLAILAGYFLSASLRLRRTLLAGPKQGELTVIATGVRYGL